MELDTSPAARDDDLILGLDPERIGYTISKLERRIVERFPGASLAKVCGRLAGIARRTVGRLEYVARPILWLRASSWIMAVLILGGFIALLVRGVATPDLPGEVDSALALFQALETGIQDVVFIGIGLAFLITAENRIRRGRALRYIHELRAIAHIVDMHQLTKDPDRLIHPVAATESSPARPFTVAELGRYLDYCSEMLSMTSKIVALYAERFNDGVVLQADDEVETLTNGLSRKIWQKIMILDAVPE